MYTNETFFLRNGFDPFGEGYVITGDTFPVKDDLKAAGAKFNGYLKHWVIPDPYDGFGFVRICAEDMYNKNFDGIYLWDSVKVDYVESLNSQLRDIDEQEMLLANKDNPSTFKGELNSKITVVPASHECLAKYPSEFGGFVFVHQFKDVDGNIFIWKTGRSLELTTIKSLTGTVKKHDIYKGIKRTILTRCKTN